MKIIYSKILVLIVFSSLLFAGCNDDNTMHSNLDYEITINKPTTDMKMISETMHIHIDFNSATSETIHHINVKIYETDNNSVVVYDKPTEAHIHEESGTYEYHHDFELTDANKIVAHTDYTLEAKVWGHETGAEEVLETVKFHVHMQ